jgi:hypothetical protein
MGKDGRIVHQSLLQATAGLSDGMGADAPGMVTGLWWDDGHGEVKGRGESGNYHHKYGSVRLRK